MAMDERLGVLYVSHGVYGVSVVDLCAPEQAGAGLGHQPGVLDVPARR